MVFIQREFPEIKGPYIIAEITIFLDDRIDRDRYVAQIFPPDLDRGPTHNWLDRSSWRRFPRHAPEPDLRDGEDRHPRATAFEAIKVTMEKIGSFVPAKDVTALGTVAEILRPQFETAIKFYSTRVRPRK
jgi:hypothetical protein